MSAKRIDTEVITNFQTLTKEKIEKLWAENVYNGDKTGIFYKQMQTKTLCTQTRKCLKNFKDRVTVFLCSKITGNDELKPILIGKSINPRAFKGFSSGSYIQY